MSESDNTIAECFSSVEETIFMYGVYTDMIRAWLGLSTADSSNIVDIVLHPLVLDTDELWRSPESFITCGEFNNAETDHLAIGCLEFGTIEGVRCVIEQNASPLAIWINKKDFPQGNK